MPFRLVIETEGQRRAFGLRGGENLVGGATGCDVRIEHPTLSRHHACLLVTPAETAEDGERTGGMVLSIADLDSENGTWHGQQRVRGARRIEPPTEIRWGAVTGLLEWIDDGDSRPARGPRVDPPSSDRPVEAASPASTTTSVGPLYTFTLSYLPDLIAAAHDGLSVPGLASRVGDALVESLPCRKVGVERTSGGTSVPLYRGGDVAADDSGYSLPSRAAAAAFSVEAHFSAVEQSRVFTPILQVAAGLLALAEAATADREAVRADVAGPAPVGSSASPPDPPTQHQGLRALYRRAEQIAEGDVHVLIRGESGTGKELLARFIHQSSRRASGPFVALNCAALSRDLQEVELFGIERGMATGVEARSGRFEEAHGGTLFLDEIGDMALDVQAKILRVLQEREVYRIGAKRATSADVRVLSATHRDLHGMIEAGQFRSDLWHRIADWECRVPALRERKIDIPNLAAFFLADAAAALGTTPVAVSVAALDALTASRIDTERCSVVNNPPSGTKSRAVCSSRSS
ncbi:MAG: sigma-54-dependent Fis family transcriptional regulator [Acidobacteriota bacterium]